MYRGIEELQHDLDKWMAYYNNERIHTGKYCYGKTPMQTFVQSKPLAQEKLLEALSEDHFVPKPSSKQREGVPKNESVEFKEMEYIAESN